MGPEDEEGLRHRLFDTAALFREGCPEGPPTLGIPAPEEPAVG